MRPDLAELVAALPDDDVDPIALRPLPIGACRRALTLGSLPVQIAIAYLAWWVRSLGAEATARDRDLLETHLRAGVRVVRTMGYLRGAAMKAGQLIAALPDALPVQFLETLESLHFEAPPMHYALIHEQHPLNLYLQRWYFELLGVLHRLDARFDASAIFRSEARVSGWLD